LDLLSPGLGPGRYGRQKNHYQGAEKPSTNRQQRETPTTQVYRNDAPSGRYLGWSSAKELPAFESSIGIVYRDQRQQDDDTPMSLKLVICPCSPRTPNTFSYAGALFDLKHTVLAK
jgi:hypothetical protein